MVKAPVGKRVIAYLIDVVLMMVLWFIVFVVTMVASMVLAIGLGRFGGLVSLILIPLNFLPFIYLLVRDGFNNGRSYGKKFMGLKVVKDGASSSYVDSIIRNITLAIPFLNIIDFILALVDANGIRIGDRIAKTQVVEA